MKMRIDEEAIASTNVGIRLTTAPQATHNELAPDRENGHQYLNGLAVSDQPDCGETLRGVLIEVPLEAFLNTVSLDQLKLYMAKRQGFTG